MIFNRLSSSLITILLLISCFSSCTWRQIGGTFGATTGIVLALAWINGENQQRREKGKHPLTDAEEKQISSAAMAIGLALGAELGGAIGDYVAKKREEYRTEAEYLNAQISGVHKSISKADTELEWLNKQSTELTKQARNVRTLPGARKEAATKLKESITKRQADADKLDKHLRDARTDTLQAYNSTQDQEKKKQLQENIKALDARISATKAVRNNILSAGNSVAYL